MYPTAAFALSVLVLILLFQLNALLGLAFLIAVLVMIPGLVLHRREVAVRLHLSSDCEPKTRGWIRLLALVGLDATGITLGVLLLVLAVVALRLVIGSSF